MSSNMCIAGLTPNGFVLPEGYSWDVKIVNGMKEGKVTVKNNLQLVHAKLLFVHDKLNGLCLFYKNGSVNQKIMYKNNVPDGWGCECDKGKEVKSFLYKNGIKANELVKYGGITGFYKEVEISTGNLISICHYNGNHIKHGKGYLYENNRIAKLVEFTEGSITKVYKTFDDEMNELSDDGSLMYKGAFEDSLENDYPRCGHGVEFVNGECVYSGEWKNGKRNGHGNSIKNGEAYYDGQWKDGIPEGEGVLFNDEGDIQYDGYWNSGLFKISNNEYFDYITGEIVEKSITTYPEPPVVVPAIPEPVDFDYGDLESVTVDDDDELMDILNNDTMKATLGELIIDEGVGNDWTDDLCITGFTRLERITVKKNSLKNLDTLIVTQNPRLKYFRAEKGQEKWEKDGDTAYAACEKIRNLTFSDLPSFTTFEPELWAFNGNVSLTLSNLPQFISFNAGESCFKDTTVVNLTGLPRLASFIAGDWTFHKLKSLTLADLPSFSVFMCGNVSMSSLETLTLSNLPNLICILTGALTCNSIKTLVLENLPHLVFFVGGMLAFSSVSHMTLRNVPYENGKYSLGLGSFSSLEDEKIDSDEASEHFRKEIMEAAHKKDD